MRYVQGRDGGGVGAVAVHPSRALFAVAERRWTGGGGPRIYMYTYPALALVRVLEGGTERSYNDICFSPGPVGAPLPELRPQSEPLAAAAAEAAHAPAGEAAPGAAAAPSVEGAAEAEGGAAAEGAQPLPPPEAAAEPSEGSGAGAAAEDAAAAPPTSTSAPLATPTPTHDRLVSVGGFPDYSLIVWDWSAPRPMLRTKAFGQDVFNARFSPDDAGRLVTSGVGHIRFWRLAETFTGLKLQGALGKFGKMDISDIRSFAQLPNGMVLSGSEGGMLLLWDGGLIKTAIGQRLEGGDSSEGGEGSSEGGISAATKHVPPATSPCHVGGVTLVELDRMLGCVITGGEDGYLSLWEYASLESADMLPDGKAGCPGFQPISLRRRCRAAGHVQHFSAWRARRGLGISSHHR